MNILSLFDGMSGARLALDDANIKVKNYYASEIDKYAITVSKANYPDIKHIGSVTELTKKQLKKMKIDLLVGGSPCFVAGTKIITSDGYKNIEDITINDKVFTHTKSFKKVLNIGGDLKETLIIKAQGIKPTETTKNHPFYIREMYRVWNKEKRIYERVFKEPIWKNAENITKGDFLGIPINNEKDNVLNLTEEECYILGRYVADGHTRKDLKTTDNRPKDRHWQLILSIGSHKLNDLDFIKNNHFSCYKHTTNVHRAVFSNKRLVEIAEKYCGVGAINKKIPQIFINLPVKLLKKVLKGYIDGDGSFRNNTVRATSISEELIMSLSQVVAKVYKTNSSYTYTERSKKCIIENRVVNQNDTYSIEFRLNMKKQSRAVVIDDIIWLPFKSATYTNEKKQVFNIEVEMDNSYTANNTIVHNCQGFSLAGKRKGSSTSCGITITTLKQYKKLKKDGFEFDGQSYLFWEYVRVLKILKKYNPKLKFLLENVKMSKHWEDIISNTLNIQPLFIESGDFTGSMRKRLYWFNFKKPKNLPSKNITIGSYFNIDDKDVYLEDITDRYNSKIPGTMSYKKTIANTRTLDDKAKCLSAGGQNINNSSCTNIKIGDRFYKMKSNLCELLMGVPEVFTNHVSETQRHKMIGNGFNIQTVSIIFKGLK